MQSWQFHTLPSHTYTSIYKKHIRKGMLYVQEYLEPVSFTEKEWL